MIDTKEQYEDISRKIVEVRPFDVKRSNLDVIETIEALREVARDLIRHGEFHEPQLRDIDSYNALPDWILE